MKKIIEGKVYNTETASLIGEYDNGLGHRDFNYVFEKLYKTKKGNYFLAGEGGANSKYSKPSGDGWCDGEGIIPLSKKTALQWAEHYMHSEIIQKEFAEMLEEA